MPTLTLVEPHWVDKNTPMDDQCAHGRVLLSVHGHELVTPQDGDFTVSAAALHLLRTLEHDHTRQSRVALDGQLFPCCGFCIVVNEDLPFPSVALGCPSGVDLRVVHAPDGISLQRDGAEVEHLVPEDAWRQAVVAFAEAVVAFYEREAPKNPIEDETDRRGWQVFREEFRGRLERHRALGQGSGRSGVS